MSIRSGFLCVPTVLGKGIALDTYITNLFECCYEHPWITRNHIKQRISTVFIKAFFLLATGTTAGESRDIESAKRLRKSARG
jgi:hypothetical protein